MAVVAGVAAAASSSAWSAFDYVFGFVVAFGAGGFLRDETVEVFWSVLEEGSCRHYWMRARPSLIALRALFCAALGRLVR